MYTCMYICIYIYIYICYSMDACIYTMFRLFNNCPDEKVIYIAPLKALARERMEDWEERFQRQLKQAT